MKGRGEEEALSLFPPTSYLFLFSLLVPTFSTKTRAWKRFLDRPEQTHLVLTDF